MFECAKFTYLSILRKCSRICFLKDLNYFGVNVKSKNQKSLHFSKNSKPTLFYDVTRDSIANNFAIGVYTVDFIPICFFL